MGKYWAEFDEGNALPPVYMKDIAFWSSLVHNGKIAYIGTDAGLYKSSIIVADPIISSDTTWTSDKSICLTGDLTISSEATLTIQPGTNIYIATNADGSASGADTNRVEIIVNGALNAAGTSSEHIRFVPCVAGDIADTAEWYGIVVNSSGSATLRYCEVERAIYGVKGNAAALDVRHTNFRYIADSGIYSTSTSNNAVVDSNTFERCYDWAVDISQGTGHDIIGNGISDCRGGIRYASSGGATALDVQYSDIDNAFFAQVGEGIHLESGGTITANITANTATGFKRGIYLSKVIGGAVTGNDAHDNNAQGLYLVNCSVSLVCQVSTFNSFCQNGIGISVNGSSVMPVAYNKIEGNTTYGVYVAPMSMPDFGTDGTATGHNAIVNTAAQYDFYRDTGPTVKAENCWWGGGKGKTYGSVDNTPYLTTDPLPRRGLDIGATLPEDVVLMKSYPNPFNPSATIEFSLPRDGRVSIEIFNIMGQRVKTLANATYTAGMHSLVWNGADEIGRAVASGIYLAMLSGEEFRGSVKMTLLR
jgi:parallel beta-helix repeat protein